MWFVVWEDVGVGENVGFCVYYVVVEFDGEYVDVGVFGDLIGFFIVIGIVVV